MDRTDGHREGRRADAGVGKTRHKHLVADFVASPVFDMRIVSDLNKGLRQEDIVPHTLFFMNRVCSRFSKMVAVQYQ